MSHVDDQLPRGVDRLGDGSYRVRRQIRGVKHESRHELLKDALVAREKLYAGNVNSTAVDKTILVSQWMEKYLGFAVERNLLAPQTVRVYRSAWSANIAHRPIARTKLSVVNAEDVEALMRDLDRVTSNRTGRPLTASTKNGILKALTGAFRTAVDDKVMASNPAVGVKGSRLTAMELHPPTEEQLRRLLEYVLAEGAKWWPMYAIAADTGIRQGELLGLRPIDVHLGAATPYIHIAGKLDAGSMTRQDWTKTKAGNRSVPLTPRAIWAFRQQEVITEQRLRAMGPGWRNDQGLVFTSRSGHPINSNHLRVHLARMTAELGLDDERAAAGILAPLRWHDFRHAYATHLLSSGVDMAFVSKFLGHASVTTTVDIYGHVSQAAKDQAVAALSRRHAS